MVLDIVHASEQTIFVMNDAAMLPQLIPGSALSGTYVRRREWDKLVSGVYAIVFMDGTMRIRRVKQTDLLHNRSLELISDNAEYKVEQIQLEQIQSIYHIDAIVRQEVI